MFDCKYLYADWCHEPSLEYQEKCQYYNMNIKCSDCGSYKKRLKKIKMVN